MINLKEKAANLPSSPGVYLMKNSQGSIIYVGKSKTLKNRVQSYFRSSTTHTSKIEKLIKNIKDFDFILTDTEFEAFMLECQLIKELKPIFNRMMKNPKSYVYIAIPKAEGKRNIEITSNPEKEKDYHYFGPFTNKSTVERALEGIKDCFKMNCSNPSKTHTPCLNYSIGLCNGRCFSEKALVEYHSTLIKIIALLHGTDTSLLEEMEQKMVVASENLDFDAAAKYRDNLYAVTSLIKKEKVIEFIEENKNIVVLESFDNGAVKLFLIKRDQVLFSEKFQQIDSDQISAKALDHFLSFPPSIGLSRDEIDKAQIIYSYLKSSSCDYLIIREEWLVEPGILKNALEEFIGVELIKSR